MSCYNDEKFYYDFVLFFIGGKEKPFVGNTVKYIHNNNIYVGKISDIIYDKDVLLCCMRVILWVATMGFDIPNAGFNAFDNCISLIVDSKHIKLSDVIYMYKEREKK
jgi:hypothetical protein